MINARSADAWRSTHQCILCVAGEMVAVFMSDDDARDGHQLSIAILSYTTCIRRCR